MDPWRIVIPVKPAEAGKTRLGSRSPALVRAIALDTIAAAVATAEVGLVLVVTDDAAVAGALGSCDRVQVVPENGTGLQRAIARGVDAAGAGPLGVMLGDLPALRPADLAEALRLAEASPRAVVADAEGTGSTLVTFLAAPGATHFGAESLRRHRNAGFAVLAVTADSTVRRDVDTDEQLTQAAALGLGVRTSAWLSAQAL